MGKEIIIDEAMLSQMLKDPAMHKLVPGLAQIALTAEQRTCCRGVRRVRTFQDLGQLKNKLQQAGQGTLDRIKAHYGADKLIFYTRNGRTAR